MYEKIDNFGEEAVDSTGAICSTKGEASEMAVSEHI